MIYVAWYFVNSLGIKNGKQLVKRNTRIIANWVLKLKIKMSRCCIILNNMLKNYLPVMMEASPSDYKKSFYCPREMRLMTLIKLVKLFVLQVSPTHYRSPTLVLIHHVPQKLNALLPLSVSFQKQQIQILYYLIQLQMTSNKHLILPLKI